jgi:hypothetical protein
MRTSSMSVYLYGPPLRMYHSLGPVHERGMQEPLIACEGNTTPGRIQDSFHLDPASGYTYEETVDAR